MTDSSTLPPLADQQPTPEDLGTACLEAPMPTDEAVARLADAGLEVVLPDAVQAEAV